MHIHELNTIGCTILLVSSYNSYLWGGSEGNEMHTVFLQCHTNVFPKGGGSMTRSKNLMHSCDHT